MLTLLIEAKPVGSVTHNLYADSDVLDTSIGQTLFIIRCLLLGVYCADTG